LFVFPLLALAGIRAGAADVSSNSADATANTVVEGAQVSTLDSAQAEQERLRTQLENAPAGYHDRYMNAGDLTASAVETEPAQVSDGYSGYLLETRAGYDSVSSDGYGNQSAAEYGLRTEFRRDTFNYGDFVLQLDVRKRSGDALVGGFGPTGNAVSGNSERVVLRSLGFPITGDIFADTFLGDGQSEVTDALARSYRLALTSGVIRGAATHISSPQFDLRAGAGERGLLIGGPYPGFDKIGGALAWLGYTRRFDEDRFAGVQIDRATHVPNWFDGLFAPSAANGANVTSWAAAAGYGGAQLQDRQTSLRATLIGSNADYPAQTGLPANQGSGAFLEGSWRIGRFVHQVGAFATDPGLYFGDAQLTQGDRGAYWRVDASQYRLSWGAGLDYQRELPQITGTTGTVRIASSRFGGSANLQFRIDRDSSTGGTVNVYENRYDQSSTDFGDGYRSLYATAFYQTRFFGWPSSRFNLSLQRNQQILVGSPAANGEELQWEQDWIRGRYETLQPQLTTTLGYARDTSSGFVRTYPTAGVAFRYWLGPDFNASGNLRYTAQSGGLSTTHGLAGTLNLERTLSFQWRAGLAASLNQARTAIQQTTSFSGPLLSRSNEKSVYLYVRWERSGGSGFAAAGARTALPGGGGISGMVFIDQNRDGIRQNDERGVAGVEVVLDGRFRTTTDRDGRYAFPLVTTGHHRLELNLDTVPLPWGVPQDGHSSVDVPLRGEAIAHLPIVNTNQ
jgi:hypothetical protein